LLRRVNEDSSTDWEQGGWRENRLSEASKKDQRRMLSGIVLPEVHMSRTRLALLVILLTSTPLLAQTTGNLEGKVTGSDGGALPRVTVVVKSPALQGVRSVATNSDGVYRFSLLPPGKYTVTYFLQGFMNESRIVTVSLGKDTALDVLLKQGVIETITVTASAL